MLGQPGPEALRRRWPVASGGTINKDGASACYAARIPQRLVPRAVGGTGLTVGARFNGAERTAHTLLACDEQQYRCPQQPCDGVGP